MEVVGAIAAIAQLAGTAIRLSLKLHDICDVFSHQQTRSSGHYV
jgi:hypothetical protein